MVPGNTYVMRIENDPQSDVLQRLSQLDSARPLQTPALVGHIDDQPVAALSLVDDRAVADPFVATGPSRIALRTRAESIRAAEEMPSVQQRVIAQLRHVARGAQA